MSLDEIFEWRVIFHGKVQGVGFRWTVVERAEEFHLLGTVENLKDQTVEAYVQGKKDSFEKFIISLKKESGSAQIRKIEIKELKVKNNHIFFKII